MATSNYTITFVSLRAGTTYVLNIGGGSGTPIQLQGGAEPFTTEEDASEDQFAPVRTQSGYFRIVDDGKDASGTALAEDWWKDLLPAKDSERPVTLSHAEGNTTVIDWQGFMQSQTFSGTLYGNPQEREFPVLCPLGVLAGEDVNFNAGIKNFAYLLKSACYTIDSDSSNMVTITSLVIQGGNDARKWLLTKVDWQNFASEDSSGATSAKYSLFEVLEDMCRFWGWTARTKGTTLYLTASDDSAEQSFLTLTREQLNQLANETSTSAGSTSSSMPEVRLTDSSSRPIFASTDQTDSKVQGPHRAVVKGDCNEHDTIVKFAPKDIEDAMGDSYTWVQAQGQDLVGYFTTVPTSYVDGIGSDTLKVWTPNNQSLSAPTGAICKRQIYQSAETDKATIGDMLMVYANHVGYEEAAPSIQLQTLRPMSFGGGSISLDGTAWMGAEPLQQSDSMYAISMRLGIGMTRQTAKWWNMIRFILTPVTPETIQHGWGSSPSIFNVPLQGNTLKSTGVFFENLFVNQKMYVYQSIPVEANTYGYIFIDIMGAHDFTNNNEIPSFEIANLEIKYSRDTIDIPTSVNVIRPRELIQERVTTKEYSASNQNDSKEEWNANCIFASDNNMEYGYGLLLDSSGNIISTVEYNGNDEHPEQHLANRVANYWATAKRMIASELLVNNIGDITPHTKVTMDSTIFSPISISRNWRDDVLTLTLLQL